MALTDPQKLLTPPQLGVARVRIPAFRSLTTAEQLRAAALALNRDLGVGPVNLRLAAQAVSASQDDVWVAYATHAVAANSALSTQVFNALGTGKTYWIDAPGGYIVGARGAAAVEATSGADEAGLPAIVAVMLSPSASSGSVASECIMVNRDRTLLNDHTLALWQAASGVSMADGNFPLGAETRLASAPSLQTVARATSLDVALRYAAVAGVVCALIAGAKFALLPSMNVASTPLKQATPGALLQRIATVAPDVLARTQNATYASGAWVFSLSDAFETGAQIRTQRALEANGLQAQATGAPTPRVRVNVLP